MILFLSCNQIKLKSAVSLNDFYLLYNQGRRNSGWAVGEGKELRAMENFKTKQIVTNYACFLS